MVSACFGSNFNAVWYSSTALLRKRGVRKKEYSEERPINFNHHPMTHLPLSPHFHDKQQRRQSNTHGSKPRHTRNDSHAWLNHTVILGAGGGGVRGIDIHVTTCSSYTVHSCIRRPRTGKMLRFEPGKSYGYRVLFQHGNGTRSRRQVRLSPP